jgi:hypothetical protein
MCSAQHCGSVSQNINDTCKANEWPVNHLVLVCDGTGGCCNCTCSCLAFGTPVLVSATQSQVIESFTLNDPVLAFDPTGSSQQRSVAFSDGTSATSVQPEMAYVTAMIGTAEHTVTVTLNHTFLLASTRKLIQAQMLMPGMDIVLANGGTAPVAKLEIKSYTGGVWNIATAIGKPANLDGHLIATNGILSGDFAVQLFYDDLVAQGYATASVGAPAVTTQKYDQMVAAAAVSAAAGAKRPSDESRPKHELHAFLAQATSKPQAIRKPSQAGGSVTLHGDHAFTLEVPKPAVDDGFLTQVQAKEVRNGLQPIEKRDPQRAGNCLWLLKVFGAIYPDIHFVFDNATRAANAFAFQVKDEPYILVQGGLVRAKPLEWQGLALVLGYLVSRFMNTEPRAPNGLVCKPRADYLAPSTLQTVFNPLYPEVIGEAIKQVEATFALIPTKADKPNGGCHPTDLQCRIDTYRQSIGFNPLPICAGGPPPADLKLLFATADTASVTLTFSSPLDTASAGNKDNYFFDPSVGALGAITFPAGNGNTVQIKAAFNKGTLYRVTVDDILSAQKHSLDPAKDSVEFTPS